MNNARKRIPVLVLAGALALGAAAAFAGPGHDHGGAATSKSAAHAAPGAKAGTLRGEIVDTGCYLAHEGRGEKHIGCATKCIAGGMPMGLLTSDGTLYLITMNHDNADPYNALKELAGKTVDVNGTIMSRGGMKGIDVASYKLAAAR